MVVSEEPLFILSKNCDKIAQHFRARPHWAMLIHVLQLSEQNTMVIMLIALPRFKNVATVSFLFSVANFNSYTRSISTTLHDENIL